MLNIIISVLTSGGQVLISEHKPGIQVLNWFVIILHQNKSNLKTILLLQGVREADLSCVCDYHNCHCAHNNYSRGQFKQLYEESSEDTLDDDVSKS